MMIMLSSQKNIRCFSEPGFVNTEKIWKPVPKQLVVTALKTLIVANSTEPVIIPFGRSVCVGLGVWR
jgi:hypothetical protein